MAKKRGYNLKVTSKKKPPKDEKKKNSRKPLPTGGTKKKSREKEKDKRTDRGQPATTKRYVKGKLQKGDSGSRSQESGQKNVGGLKKGKKSTKGRIRDFRGQFVEGQYQKRLKKLRGELIRDGVVIDGKKVTKFTSYAKITKAIYENKLFSLAESHNVSYFDVLGKVVVEVNELKPDQEIFVKVKPFFKDFRVFSIKHKPVNKETIKSTYYSQAVLLNPQLVVLIESQTALIQRVIDEFPRKIVSPLFKIKERRFENPLTGYTYALEYDYNDIIPSGMDKGEFIDFMQAIMGDEYKKIAILRMKANLDTFSDEE